MGKKNQLLLMGGDFKPYCLQLKEFSKDWPKFQYFNFVGMRARCSFPMGMKFKDIRIIGDDFLADCFSR